MLFSSLTFLYFFLPAALLCYFIAPKRCKNAVLLLFSLLFYGWAEPVPFYDMEAALGRDPYEMFLNGADALLVIDNPKGEKERELIIFRDSFGSSLAPLLIESYSKITLVDTRYINSALLGEFIDFDDQDVLFIYSSGPLNNSLAMK